MRELDPRRLCVSIPASDFLERPREIIEGVRISGVIELRLDYLPNLTSRRALDTLLKARDIAESLGEKLEIIATIREKSEGGFYSGDRSEKLRILRDCSSLVDYVDLELAIAEDFLPDLDSKVILSAHLISSRPSRDMLIEISDKMIDLGADIAKVVGLAESARDILEMLLALEAGGDGRRAIFGMGKLGPLSRLICYLAGSRLVYLAHDLLPSTARGQLRESSFASMLEEAISG